MVYCVVYRQRDIVVIFQFGIYDFVFTRILFLNSRRDLLGFRDFRDCHNSRDPSTTFHLLQIEFNSIARWACGLNNHNAFGERLSVLSDIHAFLKNFRLTIEIQLMLVDYLV